MRRVVFISGPRQREYALRCVQAAPEGYAVQIAKPTRTLEQNSKLWPMLSDLQEQVPELNTYTTDDIKLRFLNALGVEMRFLPVLEGEGAFPVGLRSSTLTKDQFSGLIELLFEYGARHGVRWSDPQAKAIPSRRAETTGSAGTEGSAVSAGDLPEEGLPTNHRRMG